MGWLNSGARETDERERAAKLMLPPDWDAVFNGTADLSHLVRIQRDLHLRLLVIEGRAEEAERLQKILHQRFEAIGTLPA